MMRLTNEIKRVKHMLRVRRAIAEIESRPRALRTSALQQTQPIIISLTSYPARYPTLHLTLKSLLRQTKPADRVILWLEHGDERELPEHVLALMAEGLEIETSSPMRSYLKIIPTLRKHPESTIITADDDVYYDARFIERLLTGAEQAPGQIISHRAHLIAMSQSGSPLPYSQWLFNIDRAQASRLVFPTGVMGVLYPPGVFHHDVSDESLFKALCPTADDVWLYWMWRLTGRTARKVGSSVRIVEWPHTQTSHLQAENISGGGNDRCINNMIEHYGFPA